MQHYKTILKRFFTKDLVLFFVALVSVSLLTFHGYTLHENTTENVRSDTEVVETIIATTTQVVAEATTTIALPQSSTTTIPILVYHQISSSNPSPLLQSKKQKAKDRFSVPADVFESQIQLIKKEGYTPLTVQELIIAKKNGTLPQRPIAITFDDGWRDQYNNALPILIQYKIPATFYIYTGVIGSPAYMNWSELQALIDLHMEIGGHTKTHPRLTKINPNRLDEEIVQSKHVLEKNLHVLVTNFAYPYGIYNDEVIKVVKQAGYTSARTSNRGIHNDFKDLYKLNVLYAPRDLKTLEIMLHNG